MNEKSPVRRARFYENGGTAVLTTHPPAATEAMGTAWALPPSQHHHGLTSQLSPVSPPPIYIYWLLPGDRPQRSQIQVNHSSPLKSLTALHTQPTYTQTPTHFLVEEALRPWARSWRCREQDRVPSSEQLKVSFRKQRCSQIIMVKYGRCCSQRVSSGRGSCGRHARRHAASAGIRGYARGKGAWY